MTPSSVADQGRTRSNPHNLPAAWFSLRHHEIQSKLWHSRARFIGVAAGRGSGKTLIARRKIVRVTADRKPWRPMYFYALPTYKQARRVAWRPILDLVPKGWIKSINITDQMIEMQNGTLLFVVGMDKPQRIEGDQWDGCILDESSDQKPGSFDLSVLPALSHKNGWCWRIGVPKRVGVGASEFKRFCLEQADEFYTWPSEDILTEDQLKFARENLDAKDYNEQYRAAWETIGGAVFHAWSNLNESTEVAYDERLPLIVSCDFNVDPMCWIIGQAVQVVVNKRLVKRLHVFDEMFVRNTNTRECLDILHKKYGEHKAGFNFYGDATAQSRNTRASETDYMQIRNDRRFTNARIYYPIKNPKIANRFATCNAAFKNAEGLRRVLVHPKHCSHLIRDLESRNYKPGTNEPDDYGDVGHITDALGYVVYQLFPMRVEVGISAPVHVSVGD